MAKFDLNVFNFSQKLHLTNFVKESAFSCYSFVQHLIMLILVPIPVNRAVDPDPHSFSQLNPDPPLECGSGSRRVPIPLTAVLNFSLNLFKSYFMLLKMKAETQFLVLIGANYSKLS